MLPKWLLWVAAIGSAHAAVILTTSGNASAYFNVGPVNGSEQVVAISWTIPQTYSDVSIFTSLFNSLPGATGVAYLTTEVGPQATPATLVDSTPFTIGPDQTDIELFNEPSLGAGTYYLTLFGTSNPADFGWLYVLGASLSAGPEVVEGPRLFANAAFDPATAVNAAYPPGSTFADFTTGARVIVSITGTPVPEPGPAGAMGMGLIGLVFLFVRRRRA